MKKLSEFRDEEALDLLADIIEPSAEIFTDEEAKKLYEQDKLKCCAYVIKNHKQAVMKILSSLEGVPIEEYHCSVLSLPIKLLEILNDEELKTVFT